ncbi:MAG TPA: 7-carboxy-7-deazaguanine synthase QueE [Candidatus Megaira endosymbiont of Nemacystus decipiens]|nr:7-carboxy-7-deazaguanine synthase QueE [Candidatus Megaera endosymbiont of Nemacystus decipiens]
MLGNNPKRRPEKHDGHSLYVKKIFKTLQGEGPNVGTPAIFVRLGGCNLACSFCDTEFEDYNEIAIIDIIEQVSRLSLNNLGQKSVHLIVITGGEPFRQELMPFCKALIQNNFKVQIETNGTLYRKIPNEVEVVCSPKVVNEKYLSIREELIPHISALKFLISTSIKTYSTVPELGQTRFGIDVFVQAMDQYDEVLNKKNKDLTIDIALNNGYRLSYQIHKELKIE